MDFYDRKRKAAIFLDAKLQNTKKTPISAMILIVESEYGLSEGFVRKRIDRLAKANVVILDREADTVSWVK